ncbi:uncharacterized protein BDV14DRAFT_201694 [Aspergillus stella-maris]|uniref:uncharacterized protein n=1 Tax=Aspergillus stella-maris TaxID=1810926 RepID=UPI003CCD73F8
MADLEEAIRVGREAIKATPVNHLDRAHYLNNLSVNLGELYNRTGAVAVLDEAIEVGREALKATPDNHPDREKNLNNLSIDLGNRYSRTGALSDLEEAIQFARQAVKALPDSNPDRAGNLQNLAIQLSNMYERTGAIINLEDAIRVGHEAVTATPDNHPNRAGYLNNLSIDLGTRYERTGAITDLEEAIQISREAIKEMPDNHPDRAIRLIDFAIDLSNLYERTGAITDLDEAIQVTREAINATPDNHPDRVTYLHDLSNDLGDRYERAGAMADLVEAIQLAREAVKATPGNHPKWASRLRSFAYHLSNRYERTGAITDLEEAIQAIREAIKATPNSHPDRITYLNDLSSDLKERYERTRAMPDLEEAILILQGIIKEIPSGHPKQATYQNNLGIQLGTRYRRIGAITDLEDAIQSLKEAIKATPGDSPSRALYLSNLSAQFNSRYSRIGAIFDLEEAIRLGQEAIETTSDDHPARVRYLHNLGNHLEDRYKRTLAVSDLLEAILYHQSALRQQNSLITIRILAGHQVIRNLAVLSDWHQCYNAADLTIHLVPQLTSRSLENSDKQHLLSAMVGLASNAASAALNAQKEALVALNLLEEGRGVLAASLEEVRVEILDLQRTYPVLAKQFVQLRNILDRPITRDNLVAYTNHESSWQAQAHRRHNADRDLDNLITKIREQPGFDRFLRAPSEEEMRLAAHSGPIVVINVSQYRCDAILITKNAIRSLPLPNLKSKEIEEKAKEHDLGSPRVLEWLWDSIMDPILKALEFTTLPPDNNWPHVVAKTLPKVALGFSDEMLLNLVLVDEVRDGGGVVEGVLAAAVNGAGHEELGAVLEGLVHEGDALATLVSVAGIGGLKGSVQLFSQPKSRNERHEIGTKQLALGYTNNTAAEITVLGQNEPGESYCHNIPSGRVNYGYLEADYDNTDDREIIVYLHP